MTTATLPAGLEPWGEALAALEPSLAVALAPMVRALDELFSRGDALAGDEGPPDGYDGLTVHGTPERMLVSEWLLADEVPDEFLRRAATGELLHLARAFRSPRRVGRVVALADTGPGQLGAARLAQLASLVVLHRRATARGGTLAVGLLGGETLLEGDATALLRGWQAGRQRRDPSEEDVERWDERLGGDDEVWLFTGPEMVLPGRRRVVRIAPGAWDERGVAALRVAVDADTVELAMPDRAPALRAMRGLGFAPRRQGPAAVAGSVRFPVFNSNAGRLLMRGEGSDVVVGVATGGTGSERAPRPRRYGFPGVVLAAAALGRRLVALVQHDDDVLRVRIAGKPMPLLDDVEVPSWLSRAEAEAEAAAGLEPVYYHSGALLCRVAGSWHSLGGDGHVRLGTLAVAPGVALDQPRVATRAPEGVRLDWRLLPGTTGDEQVVLGHDGWCAVSEDGVTWRTYRELVRGPSIVVGEGVEVLGLVTDTAQPYLVTLSPAGLVVRVVGHDSVRTLTRWSGGLSRPSVHPLFPLLAVQRAPDLVEIGNVFSSEVVQVVRGEP